MFEFDKLKTPGAIATSILVLGAVSAKAAYAHPMEATTANTPAHLDKKPKPASLELVPPGVHAVSGDQIQEEASLAFANLKERWNGVLDFHAPTKNCWIGFTDSPTSYASPSVDGADFEPGYPGTERIIQPGIEMFKGRPYAAVLNLFTSRWMYLDIKWAIDCGALNLYAFKDSPAKPLPYNPSTQPAPGLVTFLKKPASYEMGAMEVVHKYKTHDLVPSSIVPHT